MATLVQTAYFNYLTQVTTEMTIEQFKELLINDDNFNTEWSNGCTRELTFDERYTLAETIENVRIGKVQKYGEAYITIYLNDYNIPKRVILD